MSEQPGYANPMDWDNLKFKSFLGKGSFGVVFHAEAQSNGVAVKVLFSDPNSTRELFVMREKTHVNIVSCISSGQRNFTVDDINNLIALVEVADERPDEKLLDSRDKADTCVAVVGYYLIMELCGMTLRSWLDLVLNSHAQADNVFRFRVSKQVIEGIRYLHSQNIIHRDLKPANIYFSIGDKLPIKIGDFGLSRYYSNSSSSSITPDVGNRMYRAPEVTSGKYNEAADVYPIGLIILEIFQQMTNEQRKIEFEKLQIHKERQDVAIAENATFQNINEVVMKFTDLDSSKRLQAFKSIELKYVLPQRNWKSLIEVLQMFNAVQIIGSMPENFMSVLKDSIESIRGIDQLQRIMLRKSFDEYNILFHYNQYYRCFNTEWKLSDVNNAIEQLSNKIEAKRLNDGIQRIKHANQSLNNYRKNINQTDDPWETFLGSEFPIVKHADFLKVTELIEAPHQSSTKHVFQNCLPYIMQSIKMGNPDILSATVLEEILIHDFHRMSVSNSIPRLRFARLDILVAILSRVDGMLGLEICKNLGRFFVALPLIMPSINKLERKTFVVTIPWMKSIIVKRGTKTGNIIENRLFVDPYKLVLAVRTGRNDTGKSSLINSIFKRDMYTFTSRHEPGAESGTPRSLESSVEYTWLTRESIHDNLWVLFEGLVDDDGSLELFLVANLHGEAVDNLHIIKQLQPVTSAYLIFHFPNGENIARLSVSRELPENFSATPGAETISTNPYNYTTRKQIATVIRKAFTEGFSITPTASLRLHENFIQVPEVQTEESINLLKFLSRRSCAELKRELILQTQNPVKIEDACNLLQRSGVHNTLMQLLGPVLALPFETQQVAVSHLEQEMSLRSGNESKKIRQHLGKLKKRKTEMAGSSPHDQLKYNKEYENLSIDVQKSLETLEQANLGFEHLIREIGKVYEIATINDKSLKTEMDEMVKNTANLIIHGHALELVDGDAGVVNEPWLKAVLAEIDRLRPNLKIYAISIIGMQSSGKSTLLNSLFGCKFPVSAGRCTRGLFMRLLFLDKTLMNKFGIDAILLIDTEGMYAPEKMMDKNADERDRELATFAMLLSHLTIVNLMGETMKEITDILQIVIVTLARIEKVFIPPDVLLVQHCGEVDNSRIERATEDFSTAIKEAIRITDQRHANLGIVNSRCLQNLQHRVEHERFLIYFNPYKSGATANASPSEPYYKDTRTLFTKIFSVIEKSKRHIMFHMWQNMFPTYWTALKKENFALKFKNIQDVYEFIDRGARIAKVNDKTEEAVSFHSKQLKQRIREQMLFSGGDIASWEEKFALNITLTINNTIEKCSPRQYLPQSNTTQPECHCKIACYEIFEIHKFVKGKPVEDEVKNTIKNHKEKVRDNAIKLLNVYLNDQKEQYKINKDIDTSIYNAVLQCRKDHQYPRPTHNQLMETAIEIEKNVLSSLTVFKDGTVIDQRKAVVLAQIRTEYENGPITKPPMASRIREHYTQTKLGSIPAFSEQSYRLKLRFLGKGQKVRSLNQNELTVIQEAVQREVRTLLIDCERIGNIRSLREAIDNLIKTKEKDFKKAFEIGFTWEIHMFAIQFYLTYFELQLEKELYKTKDQSICYIIPKKIWMELMSDSKHIKSGRILAECILFAMLQKSKKSIEHNIKFSVLQQPWLQTVENVRLKFAEYLIELVEEENIVDVFSKIEQYYRNPKEVITNWFKDEVDKEPENKLQKNAGTIYDQQLKYLWGQFQTSDKNNNALSHKEASKQVHEICIKYLAQIDGIFYPCEIDFIDEVNSKKFFDVFFATFHEKARKEFSDLVYKRCSESRTVMDKLGCTEVCPWCGALCWGHASHDKNEDLTKKHHACHQPMGLFGVCDSDGKLLATTCENTREDIVLTHNQLSWMQIKQGADFENWIFISDAIEDYRNLMSLMFAKYNQRLAKHDGSAPCDSETIQSLGYLELENKLEDIKMYISRRLEHEQVYKY